MVTWFLIVTHQVARPTLLRHSDKKPVTATPLKSAFARRDAYNFFRIRIYANCRVSYPSPFICVSRLTTSRKKCICKSLVFCSLRTLPSSVSCNSFICHSYENCRVYTNNSHSATRHPPLTTSIRVLSLHALTNCLSRNPFCFTSLQTPGGVVGRHPFHPSSSEASLPLMVEWRRPSCAAPVRSQWPQSVIL